MNIKRRKRRGQYPKPHPMLAKFAFDGYVVTDISSTTRVNANEKILQEISMFLRQRYGYNNVFVRVDMAQDLSDVKTQNPDPRNVVTYEQD